MSPVTFGELRTAAYCPRQLYYQRRSDADPPDRDCAVHELAFAYGALVDDADRDDAGREDDAIGDASRGDGLEDAGPADVHLENNPLADEPIAVEPDAYRRALATAREDLERFDDLRDPARRDALVEGRRCSGVVHKVLEDPPEPSLISTGRPPERGVWRPQSIHAVAAAKALAWEYGRKVERAFLEYPAYGVIRRVPLSTRRKAAYRRTLRTVEDMDGPPPRVQNRSKCESCEFAGECGVTTRTLRSLLGFGE